MLYSVAPVPFVPIHFQQYACVVAVTKMTTQQTLQIGLPVAYS